MRVADSPLCYRKTSVSWSITVEYHTQSYHNICLAQPSCRAGNKKAIIIRRSATNIGTDLWP